MDEKPTKRSAKQTTKPGKRRRRQQRSTDTQQKILEAAAEEFALHGFIGTSTRVVAARAGVQHPAQGLGIDIGWAGVHMITELERLTPLFRHPGEGRDPGASGKVPNMWPLDSGFRRNDEGEGAGLYFSICVRRNTLLPRGICTKPWTDLRSPTG